MAALESFELDGHAAPAKSRRNCASVGEGQDLILFTMAYEDALILVVILGEGVAG